MVSPGSLEIPTALLCGLAVVLTHPWRWPLLLGIGLLTVMLSAVDLKHHRLPDAITLPAIPATVLLAVVTELTWPDAGEVWRAVAGGLALGGAFYLMVLAAPRSMGRGDAKLAVSLGVALGYFGWAALLLGVTLAFVLGALIGVLGVLSRRMTMKSAIPFGPALLVGCWLALAVPGLTS